MHGYVSNIEEQVMSNTNYRKVLYTGKYTQLVVMTLKVGEEIGLEKHDTVDQFFRIESGTAKIIMNGEENALSADMVAIVPAGTQHNLINVGDNELKLYTLYSPANHPDGTVQAEKPAHD